MDIVEELIRAAGRRTRPREAIAKAIVASGSHFTADDIAARVARVEPGVNLSTVYRTLEALEEAGLVDHVHLGHGRAVWHLSSDTHPHLYCESCGEVIGLEVSTLDSLSRELAEKFSFELDKTHFALVGRCSGCRESQ